MYVSIRHISSDRDKLTEPPKNSKWLLSHVMAEAWSKHLHTPNNHVKSSAVMLHTNDAHPQQSVVPTQYPTTTMHAQQIIVVLLHYEDDYYTINLATLLPAKNCCGSRSCSSWFAPSQGHTSHSPKAPRNTPATSASLPPTVGPHQSHPERPHPEGSHPKSQHLEMPHPERSHPEVGPLGRVPRRNVVGEVALHKEPLIQNHSCNRRLRD